MLIETKVTISIVYFKQEQMTTSNPDYIERIVFQILNLEHICKDSTLVPDAGKGSALVKLILDGIGQFDENIKKIKTQNDFDTYHNTFNSNFDKYLEQITSLPQKDLTLKNLFASSFTLIKYFLDKHVAQIRKENFVAQ